MTVTNSLGRSFTLVAAAALFAACGDQNPVTPRLAAANTPQLDRSRDDAHERDIQRAVETLRRVTARYHNIENAKKDNFVLLHDCETRLNDEPVGTVYVNMSRLTDGVINPEKPDALIYEPGPTGLTLVGVEFAIPFQLWTQSEPPKFLGATFQREDEFGVFALHAWVWRSNPNGLFAETNPRVTCLPA
jgi:hypothetical protein